MGFLVGCQKNDDPRITELQHQVSNADSRVMELQNQITKLATLTSNESDSICYIWNQFLLAQTNFNRLNSQVFLLQYANNSVSVSPQEKGYGLLKTPFGTLLISTESVEPYLDGFKIHLKIGNPTSAHFNGFSLICSSYQTTNFFTTLQTFTNAVTDSLTPGYWTPIDFILAPSDMDRVRNTTVSIELNQINLLKKPAPSP
jgi:Protein of unknown function (DUF3251)